VTGAGSTPAAPQAVSVLPASGSGAAQVFTFTFSDANGHADIHSARILIHQQIQGANSCYLYYTKADNKLYLHNDAANALTAPLTPGAAGSIGNSQCSVDGAGSSMTATGNTLTLNLAISFSAGYAGAKNVFGFAQDLGSLLSGWQTLGTWTVTGAGSTPAAPQAVSVLPASGSGAAQVFTFTFSDANGHADIHSARILIHQQIQGANSCYLYYTKADNKLYLHNDAANALTAPLTPGAAGSIGNSQCSVDDAGSSMTATGNTLTLNLAISFSAGYAGAKNVFGFAQDLGSLLSGWQTLGTWTVTGSGSTPAAPQAVSVLPASGSGAAQAFTFTFSDANGHADIHSARILIHSQIQGANSCYLYYTKADNKLYLHNDAANALTAPLTPGAAGTIGNSQCSVDGAASSVTASGNTLTLNLAISFSAGYAGAKNVFGFAQDLGSLLSGWQTLGTWTVTGAAQTPAAPQAVSVLPASGSGAAQAFTFTFSDANGHADIHSARILIHSQIQGANSCYLYYTKADNKLYLHNDAANALTAPLTPGAAGTIGNSQCSVDGAASSMTAAGNTLTLNLAISFSAGYAGAKNVFGFAQDLGSLLSGWQTLGTWTVPAAASQAPAAPQTVSVSPSSGVGAAQRFTFTFTDANGHGDIHSARVLIHQHILPAYSCYLYYTKADNKLYLHNDPATHLTPPLTPGNPGTIQNSQCSVDGAASSVSASGNTLILDLALSFSPGFAGTKSIFGFSQDMGNLVSNWQMHGTWSVPTAAGSMPAAPQAVSVSPTAGTGTSQLFTFTYSDADGHADIHSAKVLIHQHIQGVNSCKLSYTKASNKLYIYDDAGNLLTAAPLTPGSPGTIQNSQCSVDGAASSVSASGNTLTLNLAVSFSQGFAGTKNVFGLAQDTSLGSDWQTLGTWTVPSGGPVAAAPQAVSVSPSAGTGASQLFSFIYTDANGHADIHSAGVFILPQLQSHDFCHLYYTKADNKLNFATYLTGHMTLGSPGVLQNSRCSVDGAASSVSVNGNTLTLNLSISFAPVLVGTNNISGYVEDVGGLKSGWKSLGTWTVPTTSVPAPPRVVSVTPSSGSGFTQVFRYLFTDPNGAADIAVVEAKFTPATPGASCTVTYRASNQKFTLDISGQASEPLPPGAPGGVHSTACTLHGQTSAVTLSGNELIVDVAITFAGEYPGEKTIHGWVTDRGDLQSPGVAFGQWTVPDTPFPPQAVSVSPAAGSGFTQVFSVTFSDNNGSEDISTANLNIHAQNNLAFSCYVRVSLGSSFIELLNDSGVFLPLAVVAMGSQGTVQNSQCSVDGAASSMSRAGATLTVNLAITFHAGYAGAKQIFASASDRQGLSAPWTALGSWTVPGGP
jgi:hypothetical protein